LPKEYELEGGIQAIQKISAIDRIIGSNESKRSTKTRISSERAGLILSLLERHAKGLIKTVQAMHKEETGIHLEPEELCKLYEGCKGWVELHQFIVEHYASTEGFAIQATARMISDLASQEKQQADSSIKTKEVSKNG